MSNLFVEESKLENVNPINLLSSGIQVYFPITTYLQVGILFVPPIGHLKIYIQQEALTDDILIQIKVFELHIPITLGLLFFNLGVAHFYSNSFLNFLSGFKTIIKNNLTKQIQENLEDALIKVKKLDINTELIK